MFEKHPKPGDETVVFPSQAMDPQQLLTPEIMENPTEDAKGASDDEKDDEGNLVIDEGGDIVVGGLVPPQLVDIAVALNEDRVCKTLA